MGRIAVVVGIGDYPDPADRLAFCAADALAVSDVLSRPEYGFQTLTLFDKDATLHNIEDLLRVAFDESPDTLVFFFAGHGCETAFENYLVTYDGQSMREGFALSSLARYADRFAEKGANVVVLLDCCHSGAATPSAIDGSVLGARAIEAAFPESSARVVIAGCRAVEYSYESDESEHGLFTASVLSALEADAIDFEGRVTVPALFQSVASALRGQEQIPVMRGTIAGDFALAGGLPPRLGAPVPSEVGEELDRDALNLVGSIDISEGDLAGWKSHRYASLAQQCAGVLDWFHRQRTRYPEAPQRTIFGSQMAELESLQRRFATLDVGTRLPNGRVVEREIGSGHFGVVFEVSDTGLDTSLAYKVLHAVNLSTDDMKRRFLNGYEAMRRLDHPRVVGVYEYTDFPLGFFMELVDGADFRDVGVQVREDPVALVKFLRSVAETVAHAHERHVCHRDIKPANILAKYNAVDGAWEAYLTDFDLAWYSTRTMSTKEAYGALHYAAPEQLMKPSSNEAHLGTVDIFSFGKLLYFAVTGQDPQPLAGAVETDIKRMHVVLDEWRSAKAASEFVDLFRSCVAEDHRRRIQEFSDVLDRLTRVLFLLRDLDSDVLSPRRILEELTFALSGLNSPPRLEGERAEFTTLSGRTDVAISLEETDGNETGLTIRVRAMPLQQPIFEGASSKQAHKHFARRVDSALERFGGTAERQGGIRENFAFDVLVSGIPPRYSGLTRLQEVVSRVLETSEST